MRRILINGGYTMRSAGDDAALDGLIESLRSKRDEQFDFIVEARHPSPDFDAAFGVRTFQNPEYPTKDESRGRWLRGFNPEDPSFILLDLAERYSRADLVVLGAGNFINDRSFGLFSGMLSRLCISTFLARSHNVPIMLYGMSSSGVTDPLAIRMAQWLLDNVDAVTFRESASVELLESQGLNMPERTEVLVDPVLASRRPEPGAGQDLLSREGLREAARAPKLAIAIRSLIHMGAQENDTYLRTLARVCDSWAADGGFVVFVPQCTYEQGGSQADDRVTARTVGAAMARPDRALVLSGHYWPWEIESVFAACDVALATRLHGGAFAFRQGVPTVALAYEPKVTGFWASVGMPQFCIDTTSDATKILAKLDQARSGFPREIARERATKLANEAGRYAEIALELLDAH